MRRQLVVGLVAACSLMAAPAAHAGEAWFFSGTLSGGGQDGGPSWDNYRATEGHADYSWRELEVAAHYPGGWNLYFSYVRGPGVVCHGYAGTMKLGGMVRNPYTYTVSPISAKSRWLPDYAC